MRGWLVWPWALVLVLVMAGCATRQDAEVFDGRPVARAVYFLAREVPAWRTENGCFSCHNNGDGARVLYLARARPYGLAVESKSLRQTTRWLTQPADWNHHAGDPGFHDQRLANIQFARALVAALRTGKVKDQGALRAAARMIAADQAASGSWEVEPQNPVGSPATYGTALATLFAWKTLEFDGAPETSEARARAKRWLETMAVDNVPGAAVSILFVAGARESGSLSSNPSVEESIRFLQRAQTSDGGWGPYVDSPAEAFDTALALCALNEVRRGVRRPEGIEKIIARGREYLVREQNADGSWPATTRPSGGQSYAQRISTTAWATEALLVTGDDPH